MKNNRFKQKYATSIPKSTKNVLSDEELKKYQKLKSDYVKEKFALMDFGVTPQVQNVINKKASVINLRHFEELDAYMLFLSINGLKTEKPAYVLQVFQSLALQYTKIPTLPVYAQRIRLLHIAFNQGLIHYRFKNFQYADTFLAQTYQLLEQLPKLKKQTKDPESESKFTRSLIPRIDRILYLRGTCHFQLLHLESAKLLFQNCLAVSKSLESVNQQVNCLFELGCVANAEGNDEEALKHFTECMELSKNETQIENCLQNIVLIHKESENFDEAIEFYNKMKHKDPLMLSEIYMDNNMEKESREILENYLEDADAILQARVYQQLAIIELKFGHYEDGLRRVEQTLQAIDKEPLNEEKAEILRRNDDVVRVLYSRQGKHLESLVSYQLSVLRHDLRESVDWEEAKKDVLNFSRVNDRRVVYYAETSDLDGIFIFLWLVEPTGEVWFDKVRMFPKALEDWVVILFKSSFSDEMSLEQLYNMLLRPLEQKITGDNNTFTVALPYAKTDWLSIPFHCLMKVERPKSTETDPKESTSETDSKSKEIVSQEEKGNETTFQYASEIFNIDMTLNNYFIRKYGKVQSLPQSTKKLSDKPRICFISEDKDYPESKKIALAISNSYEIEHVVRPKRKKLLKQVKSNNYDVLYFDTIDNVEEKSERVLKDLGLVLNKQTSEIVMPVDFKNSIPPIVLLPKTSGIIAYVEMAIKFLNQGANYVLGARLKISHNEKELSIINQLAYPNFLKNYATHQSFPVAFSKFMTFILRDSTFQKSKKHLIASSFMPLVQFNE